MRVRFGVVQEQGSFGDLELSCLCVVAPATDVDTIQSLPEFIRERETERMASSLLAAMGITKPANSSFQPETFNASSTIPETPINDISQQSSEEVGSYVQPPPLQQQQQQQWEQGKHSNVSDFDFDDVLKHKEDMEKETTLQNRYVFYWLKRGKGAVSKIQFWILFSLFH